MVRERQLRNYHSYSSHNYEANVQVDGRRGKSWEATKDVKGCNLRPPKLVWEVAAIRSS